MIIQRSRIFLVPAILFTLLLAPSLSHAATAVELQAQIQSLLSLVANLQAQLSALPPSTPPAVTPPVAGSPCPSLSRNLGPGSRGADVVALQKYLRAENVYYYPEFTGYYGPATQQAVERWQLTHGVVSAGSPAINGYGLVGPRTRAQIARGCGGVPSTTEGPDIEQYSLSLRPSRGDAPLTVSALLTINGSSCTSYALDWGDGSAPLQYNAGSPSTCIFNSINLQPSHIYTTPGNYIVTLRNGKAPLQQVQIVSRVEVTVTSGAVVSPPTGSSVFSVVPNTGNAPLTATFSAETYPIAYLNGSSLSTPTDSPSRIIYFGDGTSQVIVCPPASSFLGLSTTCSVSLNHVYQNTGTYTARLVSEGGIAGGSTTIATQVIRVGSDFVVNTQPHFLNTFLRISRDTVQRGGTKTVYWTLGGDVHPDARIRLELLRADGSMVGEGGIVTGLLPSDNKYDWQIPRLVGNPPCAADTGRVCHRDITSGGYIIRARLYTPSDACFGFCAPGSQPRILATQQSDWFSIQTSGVSGTTGNTAFSISPVTGGSPLTVTGTINVTIPSGTIEVCGPLIVGTINWGDGTESRPTRLGCSGNQQTITATHTYVQTGTYPVVFTSTDGVSSSASIIVTGGTTGIGVTHQLWSATPTLGNAPLLVLFTAPGGTACLDGPDYRIEFGDGISQNTAQCSFGQEEIYHSYTNPGTYTAKLISIPSGLTNSGTTLQTEVVGTAVITVR